MEALTDEMEAMKKRHNNELLKAHGSTSESIEMGVAVAGEDENSHCFQSENKASRY